MNNPAVAWTDEDRASWIYAMHLDQLRGLYRGSDCVVVACGPSAQPHRYIPGSGWPQTNRDVYNYRWTIACNRAVGWCRADFAVNVEPRKDVSLWAEMKRHAMPWVFSHIPRDHPRVVLGPNLKTDVRPWVLGEPPWTPFGRLWLGQSTFAGIACAAALGFDTIGVIGLDLSEDRYGNIEAANRAYAALGAMAAEVGSRVVNLNRDSRVTAFPTAKWTEVRTK